MNENRGIFDEVREFPDKTVQLRYQGLVGLDDVKDRLLKEAAILVDPASLEQWSMKYHDVRLPVLDNYASRPPLFIFHGDVGTGKTALAESFGDALARQTKLPTYLFSLSLTARGTGAVGEMTTLITGAFDQIRQRARKVVSKGKPSAAYILMIDEADALAQSRELSQMHHEDRAGVNAIIRGIDDIADNHLPVVVVMCTNRLLALDPAVKRRAAADFHFERPNSERRHQIISNALNGSRIKSSTIDKLVELTGPTNNREYGFSYSDLTHRLLPALVLDAYPDRALSDDRAIAIAEQITPTPKFEES
jgi:AAA+ superfamily predicted ATPase